MGSMMMRNYSTKQVSMYARTYYAASPMMVYSMQRRLFGLPKYNFEDESYQPNRF